MQELIKKLERQYGKPIREFHHKVKWIGNSQKLSEKEEKKKRYQFLKWLKKK